MTIHAKRILILVTYYHPHWTGLTQYAKLLAEGIQSRRGYHVTVLTSLHDRSLQKDETICGVIVKRVPVIMRLSRTLVSFQLFFSLIQKIFSSDQIIIFLPYAEVLYASIVAKILGKRIILVNNGDLVLPKGLVNRCIEALYWFSTTISMWIADSISVYSMDYATHSAITKPFLSKLFPILPPFTIGKPDQNMVKHMRKLLGNDAYPVIGFAGRFVEEKGFDVLLDAMPAVINRYPNVKFVFAGQLTMDYESFYESQRKKIDQIGNRFISLGVLSHDDMASFYKLLDVFVLSSRTECLGAVQVEAMLSGVPVVATDIPGGRVAVKETGMGILVKPEQSDDLTRGILSVIKEQKKYSKMVSKAKYIYNSICSIDMWMNLLEHDVKL